MAQADVATPPQARIRRHTTVALVLLAAAVGSVAAPDRAAQAAATPGERVAGTTPDPHRDVSIARNLYDPRMYVENFSVTMMRAEYTDPVWGYQTVTLAPGQNNSASPWCAIPVEDHPQYPVITITFGVDTPTPITGTRGYGQGGVPGRDLAFLEGWVVESRKIAEAHAATLKSVRAALRRAKAAGQTARERKLTRRLEVVKGKRALARFDYREAVRDLKRLREGISYCDARRP